MGQWTVDKDSKPGVIKLTLGGTITVEEMTAFAKAHNDAIDSFQGKDYRVFCDLRHLQPLKAEAATLMEGCKSYSSTRPNFRGSAVCVSSAIIAMQHKRTSETSGVITTELISADEDECWAHLARVHREK